VGNITLVDLAKLLVKELETGNAISAGKLFTKNAVIVAPVGEIPLDIFLTSFYAENTKVCTKVHNIFSQALHGDSCAIHLTLEEHKTTGITVTFQCFSILECNNGLIQKLTINFDTYPIRQKWPELFV
jgi:hypothetical protein